MLCSGCKYPHSEVVYTRHDEDRNLTSRRRQCLRCGLRFTTNEQIKENKRTNDDRVPKGTVK